MFFVLCLWSCAVACQGIMVNLEKTGQLVHVSHLEPAP